MRTLYVDDLLIACSSFEELAKFSTQKSRTSRDHSCPKQP